MAQLVVMLNHPKYIEFPLYLMSLLQTRIVLSDPIPKHQFMTFKEVINVVEPGWVYATESSELS